MSTIYITTITAHQIIHNKLNELDCYLIQSRLGIHGNMGYIQLEKRI